MKPEQLATPTIAYLLYFVVIFFLLSGGFANCELIGLYRINTREVYPSSSCLLVGIIAQKGIA